MKNLTLSPVTCVYVTILDDGCIVGSKYKFCCCHSWTEDGNEAHPPSSRRQPSGHLPADSPHTASRIRRIQVFLWTDTTLNLIEWWSCIGRDQILFLISCPIRMTDVLFETVAGRKSVWSISLRSGPAVFTYIYSYIVHPTAGSIDSAKEEAKITPCNIYFSHVSDESFGCKEVEQVYWYTSILTPIPSIDDIPSIMTRVLFLGFVWIATSYFYAFYK